MKLEDFRYDLPERLIAQEPPAERGDSRLMVVNRKTGGIEHLSFNDLPRFFEPSDLLVMNSTRVIPARFLGRKEGTGGKVEILVTHRDGAYTDHRWNALVKPLRRLKQGQRILLESNNGAVGEIVEAVLVTKGADDSCIVEFRGLSDSDSDPFFSRFGRVPLPPYIRRSPDAKDKLRYQTVYAEESGSVAAPTAGLHFTEKMLDLFRRKEVDTGYLTLHIGPGTFRPVSTKDIRSYNMDAEKFDIPPPLVERIYRCRKQGGKVAAVGTTTVRSLESVEWNDEKGSTVSSLSGWTDLFIYPEFEFKAVDRLVTNFHLPDSTLLLLVAAFAGKELVLDAYRQAVEREYRFYSYGDAMLIL